MYYVNGLSGYKITKLIAADQKFIEDEHSYSDFKPQSFFSF